MHTQKHTFIIMHLYLYCLCTALLSTIIINTEGRKTPPEGKCSFLRVLKMLGADCSNKNLINVPKVSRVVEVLDASYNRIRILKNNSFTTYYSLKFLYLGDNSISIIEPAAFLPLGYLEVLDLSLNSIRNLPPLLPSTLRKLYISENPLETIPLAHATSLQFVSLADSFLSVLPELGELPYLQSLNLSGNPLETLKVHQLASFCHLENLRLPDKLLVNNDFLSSCDCMKVSTWVVKHSIYVDPQINCTTIGEIDCVTNSTKEEQTFAACQAVYQQQAATPWIVVLVAALAVLICAILLTILWRRRRRNKQLPPPTGPQEEARKRRLLQKTQSKGSMKF